MSGAANMIERIARIVCTITGRDPDEVRHGERELSGTTWLGWEAYVEEAREILTAMREPTEAMRAAGHSFPAKDADGLKFDPLPGEVWVAMIDAAQEKGR